MKNILPNKSMYILLIVLSFSVSCNGQLETKTQIINNNINLINTSKPKIVKPQDSSEYYNISCGIQDKNGNLWFGTTGKGVYKYDGKLFTQYTMKDGLISNSVYSLLEDSSGNIWIGTNNGICRYSENKFNSIPISFTIRPIIKDNSYYSEWSTKYTVWSMLQDKSGKIWFGTGDGVYYYDGWRFTHFLANDNVINKDNIQLKLVSDILEDKNGNIWFASGMLPGNEGLCRYDGKLIERYKPNNEGWFRNIVESKNGNLLLATRHFGIFNYDGKSFTDYNLPNQLIRSSINAIIEDKSGQLWIASDYVKEIGDNLGGLWHSTISENNSNVKTFTKISNKEVIFILEDKENNIWFSTRNMGLYRYDRKNLSEFSE
jgi:ligand-binding sensor domain-containing protein